MLIRPCILLYVAALLLLPGIPRPAAPDLSTVASGPKLPADMRQWVYGEGPEFAGLSSMRLWDRAALRQASTVASHGQMRGFVSKLHAGRPVTVVSLGDSNTQHFGGCFGRGDDAQLAARGVQTVQRPDDTYACVSGSTSYAWMLGFPPLGWLSGFMHLVNATFPHNEHLLRNMGLSGNSFRTSTVSECLESYLPKQVDLLVMEHMPFLEASDSRAVTDIERLLNRIRLYLDPPLPAVIFVNLLDIQGHSTQECALNPAPCTGLCPPGAGGFRPGAPRPDVVAADAAEAHTDRVAAHHGLASLSHVAAVRALLQGPAAGMGGGARAAGSRAWRRRLRQQEDAGAGLVTAAGLLGDSGCGLMDALYLDRAHPNTTGRILLADLLTSYLADAERHLLEESAAPSSSDGLGTSASGSLLQPPRASLDPESELVFRMRCYYTADPDAAANSGDGGGGAASQVAAVGGSGGAVDQVVSPLKVLKAEGWGQVWVEGANGKQRPGWVANAAGATLWLELDAAPLLQGRAGGSLGRGARGAAAAVHAAIGQGQHGQALALDSAGFGGPGSDDDDAGIFVSITHLQSYRRMGRANVTCVSGCTCFVPKQLDGHVPEVLASVPVPFVFRAAVPQGGDGRCVVEVQVAADEEHRRHKVKVIQVAVGALRNMTQVLRGQVPR